MKTMKKLVSVMALFVFGVSQIGLADPSAPAEAVKVVPQNTVPAVQAVAAPAVKVVTVPKAPVTDLAQAANESPLKASTPSVAAKLNTAQSQTVVSKPTALANTTQQIDPGKLASLASMISSFQANYQNILNTQYNSRYGTPVFGYGSGYVYVNQGQAEISNLMQSALKDFNNISLWMVSLHIKYDYTRIVDIRTQTDATINSIFQDTYRSLSSFYDSNQGSTRLASDGVLRAYSAAINGIKAVLDVYANAVAHPVINSNIM